MPLYTVTINGHDYTVEAMSSVQALLLCIANMPSLTPMLAEPLYIHVQKRGEQRVR